jgi:hypothetical protein
MKKIQPLVFILVAIMVCCRSPVNVPPVTRAAPDSLRLTVTSANLSENMSGNDEILVLCYLNRDSSELEAPLFRQKLRIDLKNLSRQFQFRLDKRFADHPLLLFLLEQDSEIPVPQIDSVLRVSHRAIMKEFNTRNYFGIEKYLGDEDILGFKVISKLDYTGPNIFHFSGMYKLDKYEYQVRIEGAN